MLNYLKKKIISINTEIVVRQYSYLVRPSPFSAQKTFERHNSRRKSNISFCSNLNMGQATSAGSRRGSGFGLNAMQGQPMSGYGTPRAPPLVTTKSNSLSLPDSPTVVGQQRGRSNSLRVLIYLKYCCQFIKSLSQAYFHVNYFFYTCTI